jgi:surface polysaccharide O-acyltransferase-like enzyme
MELELLVLSASVSGIIGSVAPFVLPSIFKLVGKIFKKELSKEEKRLVTTLCSIMIALVVILVQFNWTGNIETDLNNILQFFFVNFVAIKGMIQTVYELLIKSVPALNEKFS